MPIKQVSGTESTAAPLGSAPTRHRWALRENPVVARVGAEIFCKLRHAVARAVAKTLHPIRDLRATLQLRRTREAHWLAEGWLIEGHPPNKPHFPVTRWLWRWVAWYLRPAPPQVPGESPRSLPLWFRLIVICTTWWALWFALLADTLIFAYGHPAGERVAQKLRLPPHYVARG